MARSLWTLALCLLTTTAVAQSPGDEGPGGNAGGAARRAPQPSADAGTDENMDEEEAPRGERGRGADGERRRGRGGPGQEGGRFGGFRRGNPMFEALDADGDQAISTAELRKAIVALKKLDADGDGSITLAEVSPPGGPGGPGGPYGGGDGAQMVDGMIRQFDRNGDGRIGLDEVNADSLEILSRFRDANKDGALDRMELLAGAEQMRQQFGGGEGGGRFGGEGFDSDEMTKRIMANDRDGDRKLSAEEVPERFSGMLRDADEDNDGEIDARELQMATRRMGERFGRGGGRGERGPRGAEEGKDGGEEGAPRSRRQRPETEE